VSKHYGDIAFTDPVRDVQGRYGTRAFFTRHQLRAHPPGDESDDALTDTETDFLTARDGFYLATVGATGWPYVQFRGGPAGFLHVLDQHSVGWADFQGNLQYISTGNITSDDRVALMVMDYANRRRLKIYGHAHIAYAADDPDLMARLAHPEYTAVVERAVVVTVHAYDWNCPQHITTRYTMAELEPHLRSLRARMDDLEAENAELRASLEQQHPTP